MRWLPDNIAGRLALGLILACGGGCAALRISDPAASGARLPAARMSADSVGLEIAFVRAPLFDALRDEAIWSQADEQHFPVDLRRRLADNGLRCGLVGTQIPPQLQELIDDKLPVEDRSEDVEGNEADVAGGVRRLQLRSGRRAKVVSSKTFPTLPLLTRDSGEVQGENLAQAQCLFALRAFPLGDGRVRVELTPEIEHGELKQQWVEQEGSLMQRLGRQRRAFDNLRLEATLAAGQVLVIAPTPVVKGLGTHFLSNQSGSQRERLYLLVRAAQTQWDDLFAPEQITAPLATPAE